MKGLSTNILQVAARVSIVPLGSTDPDTFMWWQDEYNSDLKKLYHSYLFFSMKRGAPAMCFLQFCGTIFKTNRAVLHPELN